MYIFFPTSLMKMIPTFITQFSEENGESELTSEENLNWVMKVSLSQATLEKIVYTIRDESAIFQFAILSSLAEARE
jgi:hypothetical protein